MSAETPGTPAWLAARNAQAALVLLLDHGPLTRSRLGELSGLSKPTAAQLVARLQSVGVIGPVGEVSGGPGPNAVSYGVLPERMRGVAVDLREHTLSATVVDALDGEHPLIQLPTARPDRSPGADLRRAIDAACDAAGVEAGTVGVVVVGVQAAVSEDGDRLSFTDTLPGWPAENARTRAELDLEAHVRIANDVNLAAAAERAIGVTGRAASAALLWLGDGLGLAVDYDGVVHPGAHGSAGEIGYLPAPASSATIDPTAEDLTDLVGAPGIAALIRRHGSGERSLPELLRGPNGDIACLDLARRVAHALTPVLAIVDPELVVLGGPTGVAGGERLARLVRGRLEVTSSWSPRVAASTVSEEPVLRGARALAVADIRDRLLAEIVATPRERTLA